MTRMGRTPAYLDSAPASAPIRAIRGKFVFLNDPELFVDTRDVDRFEHLFGP